MLADFVLETVTAPGSATTINLGGAPTGRRSFASSFSNGAAAFYVMDDGTQQEEGYGTFIAGTPNQFQRTTVLANSSGTTARLNFTGATRIYCEVPAARAVWRDASNNVTLPGSLTCGTGGSFLASISNPGYQKLPSGLIVQFGTTIVTISSFGAVLPWNIAFPNACIAPVVCNGDGAVTSSPVHVLIPSTTGTSITTPSYSSGNFRVNWLAVGW